MSTSAGATDTWLVAYDIRDPRRLRRVHRCLRRHGLHVQYSVFTLEAQGPQLAELLRQLRHRIDPRADDVRAYRLPAVCRVWKLGYQNWPDGVDLVASEVMEQLATLAQERVSGPGVALALDAD